MPTDKLNAWVKNTRHFDTQVTLSPQNQTWDIEIDRGHIASSTIKHRLCVKTDGKMKDLVQKQITDWYLYVNIQIVRKMSDWTRNPFVWQPIISKMGLIGENSQFCEYPQ